MNAYNKLKMKQAINKILLFSLLFICPFSLYTQGKTDSINDLLEEAAGEEKIDLLLALSANVNPGEALEPALDAYKLAQKMGDNNKIADALFAIGNAYSDQYQDSIALIHYNKSLEYKDSLSDKEFFIAVLNKLGISYYMLNNFPKATHYYNKALKISQETGNIKEKANTYYNIGKVFRKKEETGKALDFFREAISHYKKINDLQGVAKSVNAKGLIYFMTDKYDSAIFTYNKALSLRRKIGDKHGIGLTFNNMGNVYWRWSNYDSAITYYQKALEIFEELNYKRGISSCLNNIGLIYSNLEKEGLYGENMKNYKKALAFHERALKARREIGDELEIASSLNNIGIINTKIQENLLEKKFGKKWNDSLTSKELDTLSYFINAEKSYQTALALYKNNNNITGVAQALNNIGIIYKNKKKYDKALDYFNESLAISKSINDQYQASMNLFEIGVIYMKRGYYDKALDYLYQSLDIAKRLRSNHMMQYAYNRISEVYEYKGQYAKALAYYKSYYHVQNEIFNERNYKTMQELQTKYETEKKELLLNQMQEKDILKSKVIRNQKLLIIMFIFVLAMVAGFVAFIIVQNKKIRKANTQLESQKNLISRQNREITDSIHYAGRIQQAVLTPDEIIDKHLTEYFIFYKPYHIVSGDFYWISERDKKIMVCAADCTGHGVPGAFMSMLGVSFLNEIISKHKTLHANEILEDLRDHVIKSLHQTEEGDSREGMDLSFYILNKDTMKLEYAGAQNPLIIIRNGDIIEYKGTKAPVGIDFRNNEPFVNHVIDVQKGDCIYTFSDGYQDQFGGEKGKKFMMSKLRELLKANYNKPMQKQKDTLEETMMQWMGNNYEQIDDMLVIGVRV